MLLTRRQRVEPPREGAGRGVEVGFSFPFLAAPPAGILRGQVSLVDLFHDRRGGPGEGAGRDAMDPAAPSVALAEAFLRHFPGASPSRVYVGNETCERLLPSPRVLDAWAGAASIAGWTVTLVLPPLTREGQARAMESVRAVESAPGAEVVANDWGTVHLLRSRYPDLRIVLGRLTHKVLRDPRVADLFDSPLAPMPARSALCRSGERAPGFRALIGRYGIGRREIDPFLQPLEEDEWEGRGERLSLHLPYQFVTMGRGCLVAAMHRSGNGKFVPGGPCRTECADYAVEFRVPVPGGNGAGRRLLSIGNAFYHSVPLHFLETTLSRIRPGGRVDRVVVAVPERSDGKGPEAG